MLVFNLHIKPADTPLFAGCIAFASCIMGNKWASLAMAKDKPFFFINPDIVEEKHYCRLKVTYGCGVCLILFRRFGVYTSIIQANIFRFSHAFSMSKIMDNFEVESFAEIYKSILH